MISRAYREKKVSRDIARGKSFVWSVGRSSRAEQFEELEKRSSDRRRTRDLGTRTCYNGFSGDAYKAGLQGRKRKVRANSPTPVPEPCLFLHVSEKILAVYVFYLLKNKLDKLVVIFLA